ncbi:MAG: hypothetical protein GX421_02005 [Caldisericales bacterium]|nr:hypothetical protein [Caldisericales bacterium]
MVFLLAIQIFLPHSAPAKCMAPDLENYTFHGISSNNELVVSSQSEIFWLTKNGIQNSIPANRVFSTPGADRIYFMVDEKLMSTDMEQDQILEIDTILPVDGTVEASGKWLITQTSLGTELFYNCMTQARLEGLWSFSACDNNSFLLVGKVGIGAMLLSKNGQVLGESALPGEFRYAGKYILCTGVEGCELLSKENLSSLCKLPAMDSYMVQNGHIIGKNAQGKTTFTIDNGMLAGKQMPELYSEYFAQGNLVGFDADGRYKAYTLPEFKPIKLPDISMKSKWYWFKEAGSFIIIEGDGEECMAIDLETAMPFAKVPKPASASGEYLVYSAVNQVVIHKINGEKITPDCIRIAADNGIRHPKPRMISSQGNRCTLIYINEHESTMLARVDTLTNSKIVEQNITGYTAKIVFCPAESSAIPYSKTIDTVDSSSMENLKRTGHNRASIGFISGDGQSVTIISPTNGETNEYSLIEKPSN